MFLNYDYTKVKEYTKSLGLVWMGDKYAPLVEMDRDAKENGLTQDQVERGMFHHLRQVKILFTPKTYNLPGKLALAWYFLTGWKIA